jgi:hypothetical protein
MFSRIDRRIETPLRHFQLIFVTFCISLNFIPFHLQIWQIETVKVTEFQWISMIHHRRMRANIFEAQCCLHRHLHCVIGLPSWQSTLPIGLPVRFLPKTIKVLDSLEKKTKLEREREHAFINVNSAFSFMPDVDGMIAVIPVP